MSTSMMRRAVRLFPHVPYQPLTTTKVLRRKWLVAVAELGDKSLLSEKVEKKV